MFKKEILIIFIGLCVVAAVLVLGWNVFVKTEVSVPVQTLVVSDDNKIDDSDDVEDDDVLDDEDNNDISEIDTFDWKTYQNEEFGFKFEYPGYLNIEEKVEPVGFRSISIFLNGDDLNGYLLIDSPGVGTGFSIEISSEDILIDNINSKLEILDSSVDNQRAALVKFTKNKNAFFWLFRFNKDDLSKLSLIKKTFSTFKFIEKNDTADWKTYRNEEFGFEVKYPSELSFKITQGHVGPGVPGGDYEYTATAIHFTIPTSDPAYANHPSREHMPIMTVLVYTKKQWGEFGDYDYQKSLSLNKNEVSFLGENEELIYISSNYTYELEAPLDFVSKSSVIDSILRTFKFTE